MPALKPGAVVIALALPLARVPRLSTPLPRLGLRRAYGGAGRAVDGADDGGMAVMRAGCAAKAGARWAARRCARAALWPACLTPDGVWDRLLC